MPKRTPKKRATKANGNHVARNTYTNFDGNPNPEVLKRICELLAEGKTLKKICEMEMMPSWSQVWRWCDADESIGVQFARAKEIGAHWNDDEIVEIADEEVDWPAEVARNKLRIEVRERRNARIAPAIFAERKALPQEPPKPAETPVEDDAATIAALKAIEERIAGFAKVTRGGPKLINITPPKMEKKA